MTLLSKIWFREKAIESVTSCKKICKMRAKLKTHFLVSYILCFYVTYNSQETVCFLTNLYVISRKRNNFTVDVSVCRNVADLVVSEM